MTEERTQTIKNLLSSYEGKNQVNFLFELAKEGTLLLKDLEEYQLSQFNKEGVSQ